MHIGVSIDQLSRPTPGGIGTYVRGLLHGLADVGGDHEITTFGATSSRWAERIQTLAWVNSDRGVPSGLDVVHATSLAGPFGHRAGVRRSIMMQDVLWKDEPTSFTSRGRKFHELRFLKVVQRDDIDVLVSTPELRERIVSEGVARERTHLVTLGLDHDDAIADRDDVQRRCGITGPFTLVVGTIEPRKNLERLISAFQIARNTAPELGQLVLVGRVGWGELHIPADVVWFDDLATPEVRALQQAATVSAYVPLQEGWGLPPLEALQQGTRVVVSSTVPSCHGRADVVVVEPREVDSIADGLVRALSLPDDASGREARRRSVASLTWQAMAEQHLAAWS
jgi:alpha-1,3-rhamnosyl/mannosyltransferase